MLRPLLRSKFVSFFHNEKFFHFLDGCFNRLGHLIADDILVDSNKAKVFIQSLYLTRNSSPKVISFYLGVNTSPLLRGFSKPYKFVYTGRINVSKGLTQAIDFLKTLSDYGFDCTFTIYGSDNNFLKTLKSYISEKGLEHIVFIHEAVGRGDLLVIFREFDFYLQLSPHEGMAVAVIDAMAVGLVPIVYPAGEIPAYSTHLRNSLHYDGSALRLQEIIACLKDHKLLEGIRSEAQNVRFIKQTYADSLLQALRVIGN